MLHETVPPGLTYADNQIVKMVGVQNQKPMGYLDTAQPLGMNIGAGVALAGTRFAVFEGQFAQWHRRLTQKALDFYGNQGYQECYVPLLVREEAVFGTGQYPKFKNEMFTTEQNGATHYWIPTGEVPLTNLVAKKVLTPQGAKRKLMTLTPVFSQRGGSV